MAAIAIVLRFPDWRLSLAGIITRPAIKLDFLKVRSELKTEIHKVEGARSRWILNCMLGQTAVLAGMGYFVLEHFRR